MLNRHKYLIIICCIALDVIAIFLSTLLFLSLASTQKLDFSFLPAQKVILVSVVSWVISSLFFRMNSFDAAFSLEALYRSTWRTFVGYNLLFESYLFFYPTQTNYHNWLKPSLLQASILLFYLVFSRLGITFIVINLKHWQKQPYKVAIWGFNKTSIKLATKLENNENANTFIGILNEDTSPIKYQSLAQFDEELTKAITDAIQNGIRELYVVSQPEHLVYIDKYFKLADRNSIRLKFIPDFSMSLLDNFVIENDNNFSIIKPRTEPLELAENRFKKRLFDFCFSLLIIIFVLSWLYPILAIIIKLQSKGPVIFKQLRTGENNKEFWCYKFRSMAQNKDSNSKQAQKNDVRITPIGRFLRKTSIDELPQFFNVLKGEMSVVGPRPHMLKHTHDYNQVIDNFMVRHFIKPGITGLSQISGFRGETKEIEDMQGRVNTDIEYLQNWSLIKDIKICILTIFVTLKGDEKAF